MFYGLNYNLAPLRALRPLLLGDNRLSDDEEAEEENAAAAAIDEAWHSPNQSSACRQMTQPTGQMKKKTTQKCQVTKITINIINYLVFFRAQTTT